MTEFLHNPIVQGAISGALGAAAVDYQAFRAWRSFREATTYAWGMAAFRWVQGAVIGGVTAAGLGAVL